MVNSEYIGKQVTITAAGELTSYLAVGYDNKIIDGAGEKIAGLTNSIGTVATGKVCPLVVDGIVKWEMETGETIARGDDLMTAATGKAAKWVATNTVAGVCWETVDSDGYILVKLL